MNREEHELPVRVNGTNMPQMNKVRATILSSSTSRRIAELRSLEDRSRRKDHSSEIIPQLLHALFDTYSLYTDRPSRRAASDCLLALFADPAARKYFPAFITALKEETSKPGIAPTNAFVLLEWCSILLQACAESSELWTRWGIDLLLADARVLELCLAANRRNTVTCSALVVTRRALRAVFRAASIGDQAIRDAVKLFTATGSNGSTAKNAVYLGVIAGVSARLPQARRVLEQCKSSYIAFYVREIIGSRSAVPKHIAVGLDDFFSNFVTPAELSSNVIPALEKALLRAPEVVLNGVASALFHSLYSEMDLTEILLKRLLKPLLSNVRSTNVTIREGALHTFIVIVQRCRDEAQLILLVSEILDPLKSSKITNADHKVLHAKMLAAIPPSLPCTAKITGGLAGLVSKEPSEAALAAETEAMVVHLSHGFQHGVNADKAVLDAFTKGLNDKKVPTRRIWCLRVGDLWWGLSKPVRQNPAVIEFLSAITDRLNHAWSEVVANPLPAAQSGLVTAGYLVTAMYPTIMATAKDSELLAAVRKVSIAKNALALEPRPSFLLNHRIYTKLTSPEDLTWCLRALSAMSTDVVQKDIPGDVSDAWSQAYLYMITASVISPELRREATRTLSSAYVSHPAQIAHIIISGLWLWRGRLERGEKDTAAFLSRTGNDRIHSAIRTISLPPAEAEKLGSKIDREVLEQQLIEMLIPCRPSLFPRVSWIETCQRIGVDPGDLTRQCATGMLKRITGLSDDDLYPRPSGLVLQAAHDAAAELAFVAPDAVTARIIEQFEQDVYSSSLDHIGPTEAAIFRTPEGTIFVDVLDNKSRNQTPDRNDKDYETLKWEAELRAQLAHKKGQSTKLTAEEQTRVNAQAAKEVLIRQEVAQIERKLRRAIGLIQSLATGPPTEADTWLGHAVRALLHVMLSGAGLVVGETASTAFLSCATQVTSRLGPLRTAIGVATLRARGISQLPAHLEEEPLGEQVTRVLYRLRFMGEQRPFDTASLLYMLSLIFCVLEKGGVGTVAPDEMDEQVVLALEFLSFHTAVFANPSLPRKDVISVLLTSMQKYNQHYKVIKDCLLDLARCIAPTLQEAELSELVRGAIVPEVAVRTSVLQAIHAELDLTDLDFSEEIWLACHDEVEENVELAQAIWEENALEADASLALRMVGYLDRLDKPLRRAAARAIADSIRSNQETFTFIVSKLQELYHEKARPIKPQLDEYGMPRKMDLKDPWEARDGVAAAFRELSSVFDATQLVPFIGYLIEAGPLGDRSTVVREEMVDAATIIIAKHGKEHVEELMQIFERTLATDDHNSERQDWINEAVVILYGALARHLRWGDERVPKVVQRLLSTLSTPSESVQYAVAECLPPLVRASREKVPGYVQQMLDELVQSPKYAGRRGAAYGLAGIVQGKGVSALREYRIMSTLRSSLEDKKDVHRRQGALLAYELFAIILGRVFEPYVIQIVPPLLSTFGDASTDVREACLEAAKACFASMSSYGVKQILPTLLDGLDEPQWRSKKGACDLLGAMAYLDPQQLALSLPDIIPPLTTVLNDSHKEVRSAANRSLQRFGEVISNPEVKGLVGILLKALSDPTKYTDVALDALIKVSFIHYLDSPSLALIVRILERGLSDRSATKRKSAQIIGSLAHLSERKDLIMHLPILIAGLKLAIVDPVPTTRATASKALGSLIEKLGEDALPDLIPGLMATLKSETGAGDRLGSAQALSEVLAGLGTSRLEETLPTILQNVSSTKPSVREGFMSLFIFLPACFGNGFATYLNRIIPPILAGLADDVESIRDTSLRAGRLLVKNFATRAIDLLLPELERGLADDSHRIRLSSVELVGDLLFNLTGISGKTEGEDDEGDLEAGAGEAGQSLLEVLGEEKRNKVLSSLYICRCDTSGLVRSAAINVWKALVATPRTLKELLPTLTQLLIRRLASANPEQKMIAGNALGELIRKAGEGVLASLLPTLEAGLQNSTDTDAKQGICIALRELISSASPEVLEEYERTLISVVRTALVDPDAEVREAAAEAFDSLQRMFGKRAVDQVLPHLLHLLRTEGEAGHALSALLTLLTDHTRSNIILPNLIPTLLTSPISAFNARALASLARVAGPAMTRRLPTVLHGLMDQAITCSEPERRVELDRAFDAVLLSVDEHDGLNTAMALLLVLMKHNDERRRAAADHHLARFFQTATIDLSRYHPDLIRVLLVSFEDRDPDVVHAAWTALTALMQRLKKEEMESLVLSTRQVLQGVGVAGSNLAGFAIPKGINAILPIFLQGLMNGTPEQRTQSALAISDIIDRTSGESLRPSVTQITGPLIRVVSERSTEVKAAILLTLHNLLEKIPTHLKPFLPQLQRTFAKSLADPTSELLRSRAAKALGTLITLTPRIDPLIAELVTGTKTSDAGVRTAMLQALSEVVGKAGANMSEASKASVLGLMNTEIDEADDAMAITHARLLGALIGRETGNGAASLIKQRVLTTHFTKGSVLALNAVLLDAPHALTQTSFANETPQVICQGIASKIPFIGDNSVLAAGKYLLTPGSLKSTDPSAATSAATSATTRSLLEALTRVIQPGNPVNTRRLALVVIRTISRHEERYIQPHLALLAPPIFASVRDPVIPVKLAAEAAFLAIFAVVEQDSAVFDKYISSNSSITTSSSIITSGTGTEMTAMAKKSMQDYFKRVVLRLGAQARERREAEGGQGGLGLSEDEKDDEREVWSIGKVDLGEAGGFVDG